MTETERKLIRGAMYELGIDTLVGAGERLNDAMRYDNVQSIRGDNAVAALILSMQQSAPDPYKPAIANLIAELNITEPSVPVEPEPVVDVPAPQGDFAAQVLAVLAANGVFIKDGKLGLGQEPIQNTDARLTIKDGQIVGTNNGNSQNPVPHANCLDICNSDGGFRALQYGWWFQGKRVRNTENREMSVFALMDSMGNACMNDTSTEPGQAIYFFKDPANQRFLIACYKPGWTVHILETSAGAPYSAMDVEKL